MDRNLSKNLGKYVIRGGKVLQGEVEVSGAKNAVLPILAACLLSHGRCVLHNVPDLADVKVMVTLLTGLGAKVKASGRTLVVDGSQVCPLTISPELLGQMRASNLVLGPILARFKEAEIAYPGGCSIGRRPMDYHLQGLTQMGAKIIASPTEIFAFTRGLKGAEISFDFPSVGATENIMMAAALAEGETIINNPAEEPEVIDLANFINSMGGKIKGAGTNQIVIQGVKRLGNTEYRVMPDRVEAGTLLLAGAITGGQVVLDKLNPLENAALIDALKQTGANLIIEENRLGIRANVANRLNCVDVSTMPYPGFPTDLQPQFMTLMTLANGQCKISENLFENRFKHVEYLKKMGANIKIKDNSALICGVKKLQGAEVSATDLRAGAALVLAGLGAEGLTIVDNLHFIDRGYENFEAKLQLLGADICRKISPCNLHKDPQNVGGRLFNEKRRIIVV